MRAHIACSNGLLVLFSSLITHVQGVAPHIDYGIPYCMVTTSTLVEYLAILLFAVIAKCTHAPPETVLSLDTYVESSSDSQGLGMPKCRLRTAVEWPGTVKGWMLFSNLTEELM